MYHIIFVNLISLLGLSGFLLASYIYSKKKTKKKLICPMRSNCDTVIHSDYSKILGIPVEILGMIYYAIIGCVYSIVFIIDMWSFLIAMILLGISFCAVLFSVYLISIQAFVVKHWCTWCLCSAFISILIAGLSYLHYLWY